MSTACCKKTRLKLIHDIAAWLRPSDPSVARALELNWIPKSERGAYRSLRHEINSKRKLPDGMRWRGGIIHARYTDSRGKTFERSTGSESPTIAARILSGWKRELEGGAIPLPNLESNI
jgi:hypothetical protein